MKKVLILVVSIFFLGCRDNVELKEYFMSIGVKLDRSRSVAIVIPQNGCPGCLKKAFDFYHRTREGGKVWFVLTEVSDLRLLKMKVNSEFREETTVLDQENLWRDFGLYSTYPLIVINDNGKLSRTVADPGFTDIDWTELIEKHDL